jgi:hypothetical protein
MAKTRRRATVIRYVLGAIVMLTSETLLLTVKKEVIETIAE